MFAYGGTFFAFAILFIVLYIHSSRQNVDGAVVGRSSYYSKDPSSIPGGSNFCHTTWDLVHRWPVRDYPESNM